MLAPRPATRRQIPRGMKGFLVNHGRGSFGSHGTITKNIMGKTGILVVTDLFTLWMEVFAILKVITNSIVAILQSEVFSRYGYPRCLLSDNGSQFTSSQ